MTERKIDVGMGEYAVGEEDTILSALGIGSCVAVSLIKPEDPVAGLAHVMLPEEKGENGEKHADVLLDELIECLEDKKCVIEDLDAKIFGGASMFGDSLNIGKRNVESVKEILSRKNIDIKVERTGGHKGRATWLNCRSGDITVRKKDEGTKIY